MTSLAYQKAFAYENFTWDNTSVSMGKEPGPRSSSRWGSETPLHFLRASATTWPFHSLHLYAQEQF